jgi:hypothetical protein
MLLIIITNDNAEFFFAKIPYPELDCHIYFT